MKKDSPNRRTASAATKSLPIKARSSRRRPSGWLAAATLAALLASAVLWVQTESFAQTPVPEASNTSFKPELGEGMVVWRLFALSPTINSIILILSVIATVLFVYFLTTVKGHTMAPPAFVSEFNKLVQNQDFKQGADYCRDHEHVFIASILQRCAENTRKPHAVLMDMIDTEGRRRADIVWNRISYLSDISNVAPMLGLVGTVLGMIRAFYQELPEGSASISAGELSRHIGGAMATTLFGLTVGILALAFYAVIKGRVTQALADAEQAVHTIADQIKRDES